MMNEALDDVNETTGDLLCESLIIKSRESMRPVQCTDRRMISRDNTFLVKQQYSEKLIDPLNDTHESTGILKICQ